MPKVVPRLIATVERAQPPHRLLAMLRERGVALERVFLLDSALSGRRDARWSFLAANPYATLTAFGTRIESSQHTASGVTTERFERDPLDALQSAVEAVQAEPNPDAPFVGGAVGVL
ncbi:MAG: hypothetical protein O3A46_15375, partial [Candidatus Poribacteria bacterium]|nr:hypothetical protein [Candidatus Poribacteria bacterium]